MKYVCILSLAIKIWQLPASETCKSDIKVNDWKFDRFIIGDEIEGIGEGQACPPAVSCVRGGHVRRSAATVCMCTPGRIDLEQSPAVEGIFFQ